MNFIDSSVSIQVLSTAMLSLSLVKVNFKKFEPVKK